MQGWLRVGFAAGCSRVSHQQKQPRRDCTSFPARALQPPTSAPCLCVLTDGRLCCPRGWRLCPVQSPGVVLGQDVLLSCPWGWMCPPKQRREMLVRLFTGERPPLAQSKEQSKNIDTKSAFSSRHAWASSPCLLLFKMYLSSTRSLCGSPCFPLEVLQRNFFFPLVSGRALELCSLPSHPAQLLATSLPWWPLPAPIQPLLFSLLSHCKLCCSVPFTTQILSHVLSLINGIC